MCAGALHTCACQGICVQDVCIMCAAWSASCSRPQADVVDDVAAVLSKRHQKRCADGRRNVRTNRDVFLGWIRVGSLLILLREVLQRWNPSLKRRQPGNA